MARRVPVMEKPANNYVLRAFHFYGLSRSYQNGTVLADLVLFFYEINTETGEN